MRPAGRWQERPERGPLGRGAPINPPLNFLRASGVSPETAGQLGNVEPGRLGRIPGLPPSTQQENTPLAGHSCGSWGHGSPHPPAKAWSMLPTGSTPGHPVLRAGPQGPETPLCPAQWAQVTSAHREGPGLCLPSLTAHTCAPVWPRRSPQLMGAVPPFICRAREAWTPQVWLS